MLPLTHQSWYEEHVCLVRVFCPNCPILEEARDEVFVPNIIQVPRNATIVKLP